MEDLDILDAEEDGDPPEQKGEREKLPRPLVAAFNALYVRYHKLVQKKLERRDIDPASAREIHQDVFLILSRRLEKHGVPENPEALLTKITGLRICNYLRRRKRQPLFEAAVEVETIPASLGRSDVERLAREGEYRRIVDGLLTRMDGYEAALVALIDIDGMSYEDAAWFFERPFETIRTQHRRAREKMRGLAERLYKEEMAAVRGRLAAERGRGSGVRRASTLAEGHPREERPGGDRQPSPLCPGQPPRYCQAPSWSRPLVSDPVRLAPRRRLRQGAEHDGRQPFAPIQIAPEPRVDRRDALPMGRGPEAQPGPRATTGTEVIGMAKDNDQDSSARQRKRWLETLLDRMTAPADVMRQHLDAANQAAALGSAAEAGVRDLLRVVLPQRLAVTSGFLREPGRSLVEKNPKGAVSPQTDVIVYDGSQATPLHSIGGIEIVAAPDILGIVEVKDAENGSGDLEGEKGALAHTRRLAMYSPYAFRGIVLFRGKAPKVKKDADKTPEPDGKEPEAEVKLAERLIAAASLQSYEAPHVVYCSSCTTEGGADGGYVAFYDFLAKKICLQEYKGDRSLALAAFLRIVTGFFSVRGLISPSLHLDLLPAKPERGMAEVPVTDAEPAFASLHRSLLERRNPESPAPFFKLFVDLLKEREAASARSHVVTGRDAAGLPTAGFIVLVEWPARAMSAAFFYLIAPGVFACTDASAEDDLRWTIEEEVVPEYVRRALHQSDRDDNYNVVRQASTQQTGTNVAEKGPERATEATR